MTEEKGNFLHHLDKSAVLTVIGIILLFSMSVMVILIAPTYVDPTWTEPTSSYQVQMYEVSDPNFYIGTTHQGSGNLQALYHIKEGFTFLAFQESEGMRIVAPPELNHYVTKTSDLMIKLSTKLLMLRKPQNAQKEGSFNAKEEAEKIRKNLQNEWEKDNPNWKTEKIPKIDFEILELYEVNKKEIFGLASVEDAIENWVDKDQFVVVGASNGLTYDISKGTIYVHNPKEFRIKKFKFGEEVAWQYDPEGVPIENYEILKSHPLTFKSRQELIRDGEHLYATEGCWYCHTDQTRTLIQDVVLNGSASYPAPPSSANEYIYQHITFPGTKRNGPDLSRAGIKRPSRDWHRGHFWSPKTASIGSIMPAFKHFFDNDPSGINPSGHIPNYKFESIFQYLMTKGTRITPPTQAWWLGKDPINTKAIIEGRKKIEN
jgi:cytochrome c oxidase cbb3-type subunit II